MAFPLAALIPSALGFVSGLLDDSADTAGQYGVQAAQATQRKAYPGQKLLASKLAPYLWENLGIGLTEEEKSTMRGAGRTGILQSIKANRMKISDIYASQGLRGGTVASALKSAGDITKPFAELESGISMQDINLKRKRISDIINFLNLQSGAGYDIGEDTGSGNISDELKNAYQSLGYSGFVGGAGMDMSGMSIGDIIGAMQASAMGGDIF